MSAHVLLNLLSELQKRDKMRGFMVESFQDILLLTFYRKSASKD